MPYRIECHLTPSCCYPSKRLVGRRSGIHEAWKLSEWGPGHRQGALTSEVTLSYVVTLAPNPPLSGLKCWHQSPVFRCLLCILLNLGHVSAPPMISCLAAVRWQSPRRREGRLLCAPRPVLPGRVTTESLPLSPQQQGKWHLGSLKARSANEGKEFIFS